jgi:hypothetical protein
MVRNLYLLDGLDSAISVTQNEQLAGRNSEALFDRGGEAFVAPASHFQAESTKRMEAR